ncbi:uncharacterized protein PV07_10683 [Cladophialophora immunda]|uniref:Uncharacterized protein n=1 Tax=Cladophialophora immunda TaxID=569365 RepID=A0A0D2AJI4_9EURO|nr:uncharacterized protein PV07_10683 [Cladophialophora immunda]KIW25007.1 hypothetical protein PV07_10683 [Cladophialophora immunda]
MAAQEKSRAQPYVSAAENVFIVISNYQKILSKATELGVQSAVRERLFSLVFDEYLPELRQYAASKGILGLRSPTRCREDQETVEGILTDLEELNIENHPNDEETEDDRDIMNIMNPLVLLLYQAIEREEVGTSDQEKEWGPLSGFKSFLSGLEFEKNIRPTKKEQGEHQTTAISFWPGLPTCIMTSLSNSSPNTRSRRIYVSATRDHFDGMDEVDKKARNLREDRLRSLEEGLSPENKNHIDLFKETLDLVRLAFLENMAIATPKGPEVTTYDYPTVEPDVTRPIRIQVRSFHAQAEMPGVYHERTPGVQLPVNFPFIVSTWNPRGEYYPACYLDKKRFEVTRPERAQDEEQRDKAKRKKDGGLPKIDSCAEWEGYLSWLNRPEPVLP